MLVGYIVMTGLSVSRLKYGNVAEPSLTMMQASFASDNKRSVGIAIVPILFIYYGFYDIGWTPLPCESISSLHVRVDVLTSTLQSHMVQKFYHITCASKVSV
jgi:hypothetical protein